MNPPRISAPVRDTRVEFCSPQQRTFGGSPDCSGAIFSHEEILRRLLKLRNGLARHIGQAISYVIIGASGFLGIAKNKIVLPGATKEAVKALPKFEYAKS